MMYPCVVSGFREEKARWEVIMGSKFGESRIIDGKTYRFLCNTRSLLPKIRKRARRDPEAVIELPAEIAKDAPFYDLLADELGELVGVWVREDRYREFRRKFM